MSENEIVNGQKKLKQLKNTNIKNTNTITNLNLA
jgi:hypothetical protein